MMMPRVKPSMPLAALARGAMHPLTWTVAALLLLAILAIVHVLGWREDTAIISGTFSTAPGSRAAAQLMLARGIAYGLAWFAAAVAAPILLLAAAFMWVFTRLSLFRRRPTPLQ
jgi:hypothetical protein